MAKVQARNPNGSVFSIEEGEFNSLYKPLGWSLVNSSPSTGNTTNSGIKTNRSDVVANFYKYMGRNPITDTDWKNVETLMKMSPQDVEKTLAKNANEQKIRNEQANKSRVNTTTTVYNTKTGQKLEIPKDQVPFMSSQWSEKTPEIADIANTIDEGTKNVTTWLDGLLDSGQIDKNKYDALLSIADNTEFNKTYTDDEIKKLTNEYDTAAREELSPYYANQEERGLEDLKKNYDDIKNSASRFQQQEAKSYKETLAETKKGLRARGLTFSGRSRGVLGKEGALDWANVEGELPQQRRYNYEDTMSKINQDARDLGMEAERKYGSTKLSENYNYLNPQGLANPYGGGGIDYDPNNKSAVFLPHNNPGDIGYVSKNEADIEKEKELEVQKRIQQRLDTLKY